MAFGLKVLMNSKDHFEISFYLLNWKKHKCLTVHSVGKSMFPKIGTYFRIRQQGIECVSIVQ